MKFARKVRVGKECKRRMLTEMILKTYLSSECDVTAGKTVRAIARLSCSASIIRLNRKSAG